MTPLISVILPSLFRIEMLRDTVQSFFRFAKNPAMVEFVIRLDRCDSKSVSWGLSQTDQRINVIIGENGNGHLSLARFMNTCAAAATGDWIFPTADDCRMMTYDWDQQLIDSGRNPLRECCAGNVIVINGGRLPILSRRLYETLGSIGETPHYDCYTDFLIRMAGIDFQTTIKINNLAPPPPLPRNLKNSWAILQQSSDRFNLDKIKLGAVLGKSLGDWLPSEIANLETDATGMHAKI